MLVSSRFGGGSGLKPGTYRLKGCLECGLPSLRRGSGLKHAVQHSILMPAQDVSPRFGGGSGLKQHSGLLSLSASESPLASAGGVD